MLSSDVGSPLEQCVRIMVPRTKDEHPYTLAQNRNPHDYENVYTLATEHPTLLSGIIHKEQHCIIYFLDHLQAEPYKDVHMVFHVI